MPEAFKLLINAALVRAAGAHFQRVWPPFDRATFERLALTGLDALELKARAMQVATALEATLPTEFSQAAEVIEAALAPPAEGDELSGMRSSEAGLAGWIGWPLGEFVARRGLAEPVRALACLRELTQRFTAEWAIRPFLLAHPELGFASLRGWLADPSAHVRRLVSEGSRPRLPWGLQLKPLITDPTPTLSLLERLQDDPSAYVRRSVANHLNDIGKDHPQRLIDWLQTHLPGASPERRALLKHASRSLIKAAVPAVLAVWGLGERFCGTQNFKLSATRVAIGGSLQLQLELRSAAVRAQPLLIDYLVHHVKANGSTSAKVFKGWKLELGAGEQRTLDKKHSLKIISTRVYYPGPHRIELQVNGQLLAAADFELLA